MLLLMYSASANTPSITVTMPSKELRMDTRSILGMMHAEEALLISVIRSLPSDIKSQISNDFHQQVEISETSHLGPAHDRESSDAFKAHLRRLSIVLAALS